MDEHVKQKAQEVRLSLLGDAQGSQKNIADLSEISDRLYWLEKLTYVVNALDQSHSGFIGAYSVGEVLKTKPAAQP